MRVFRLLTMGLALTLIASGAMAATYVIEEWDGGVIEGWNKAHNGSGDTTISYSGDIGGTGQSGVLIDGSAADFQDLGYIYDPDGDALSNIQTGNDSLSAYNFPPVAAVDFISFDFYANSGDGGNAAPAALAVYFYGDNGALWRNVVYDATDDPLSVGWRSYTVAMGGGAGWDLFGGSGTFADSIAGIQQIGIEVTYRGNGLEEYGLDNFQLSYPEPGTYAVLAFALLSLGVTFRGKLRTSVKDFFRK